MMKRFLAFLSSLRLTFWLLMGVTILFVMGGQYSRSNRELFESLDTTTVQAWLQLTGFRSLHLTWWVLALFCLMFLLGINTILCAQARILELWRRRSGTPSGKLFILFIPSVIHIIFVLMLSGHLLTFTLGRYDRIPIQEGSSFSLPSGESFVVEYIRQEKHPSQTRLGGRIRNITTKLRPARSTESLELKILGPMRRGSFYLHLDMVQGPGQGAIPQVFLVVTRDPGLPVIVFGLSLLIALMLIYYAAKLRNGLCQERPGAQGLKNSLHGTTHLSSHNPTQEDAC